MFESVLHERKSREVRVMKIIPLRDRILIKSVGEEEKTKGGVIIPDTAKEKPMQGRVIAVGKGALDKDGRLIPPEVKEGVTVLFGKYAGTEIKVEGEEHLIVREDDILGIVEE
jgi:chaperonin GroES